MREHEHCVFLVLSILGFLPLQSSRALYLCRVSLLLFHISPIQILTHYGLGFVYLDGFFSVPSSQCVKMPLHSIAVKSKVNL